MSSSGRELLELIFSHLGLPFMNKLTIKALDSLIAQKRFEKVKIIAGANLNRYYLAVKIKGEDGYHTLYTQRNLPREWGDCNTLIRMLHDRYKQNRFEIQIGNDPNEIDDDSSQDCS